MMIEVERRICHVCASLPREYFCGICDGGRDYDALTAQRDEGLAREAELKRLLILAWDGQYIGPEDCKKLDALCDSPGCADGEKS